MSVEKNIKHDDEIDLLELTLTLWNSKLKILFITFIFTVVGYVYYATQKVSFIATTDIKPITYFEEFEYEAYNHYINNIEKRKISDIANFESNLIKYNDKNDSTTAEFPLEGVNYSFLSFNEINKSYLLNLFINKLRDVSFLESQIKNFNLIDNKKFKSNKDYDDAVKQLANSIKLQSMVLDHNLNLESNEKGYDFKIQFKTQDINIWENFLRELNISINKSIQTYLQKNLNKLYLMQKKLIDFQIEDFDDRIGILVNANKKKNEHLLTFLNEQALIARQLDIKNIDFEKENLFGSGEVISNIHDNMSYYLKGYQIIENEIELIKNRSNNKAFIKGLAELEKKRNEIEIGESKTNERIQTLFLSTPIFSEKFYAGNLLTSSTDYKSNKISILKILFLSIIIGLIFSFIYILLLNAIRKRI